MATFQKGHGKHGGRKKGVPNKWNFQPIRDICEARDYDPLIKLIDLLPNLDYEAQARVHIAILSFTRAKPKIEVDVTGGLFGLSNPLRKESAEDLIKLLPVTNAQSRADRPATAR